MTNDNDILRHYSFLQILIIFMAADFTFLETDELDLLDGSGVLSILHHHVCLVRLKSCRICSIYQHKETIK